MVSQQTVNNRILAALLPADFQLIAPYLEEVDFPTHFKIAAPREPLEYIYFPERGIGAVIAVSPDAQVRAEAGMFGHEGFVPSSVIIGDDEVPYYIEVNIAGSGYRLPIKVMRDATLKSPTLQIPMIKYMHIFACQVAYTSLASAKYDVPQRLARWLLMCHDRIKSNEMAITHDYIAFLLGVRRPGVTTALHILEGKRLIRSLRGLVVVLDRKGLEEFAQGCYGVPEQEFERLIGPARSPSFVS
jgi:CRP-like cAMP-binding protein